MIPFTNATLTAITAPGSAADYDLPATTGAARWTGSAGIYIAERLEQLEGASVDEVVQTRAELPYKLGILVQRGDTLTYIYEGTSRTRKARNLIHAQVVGRVRVTLEDA